MNQKCETCYWEISVPTYHPLGVDGALHTDYRQCALHFKDDANPQLVHKDETCERWEKGPCKPRPTTVLGFPVVYVERSPDAPPAEDIICGSWNDVHVGLII